MKATITLSEPCTQTWNSMKSNEKGRHCGTCNKTVIDFTTWATEDVAAYLLQHAAEKPCGRFLKEQLNTPIEVKEIFPRIIDWNTSILRKVAALIVVCFALTTTSCNTSTSTGEKYVHKTEKDTSKQIVKPLTGDTLIEIEAIAPPPPNFQNIPNPPQPHLLGEPAIVPTPEEPVEFHTPEILGGAPVLIKIDSTDNLE